MHDAPAVGVEVFKLAFTFRMIENFIFGGYSYISHCELNEAMKTDQSECHFKNLKLWKKMTQIEYLSLSADSSRCIELSQFELRVDLKSRYVVQNLCTDFIRAREATFRKGK